MVVDLGKLSKRWITTNPIWTRRAKSTQLGRLKVAISICYQSQIWAQKVSREGVNMASRGLGSDSNPGLKVICTFE